MKFPLIRFAAFCIFLNVWTSSADAQLFRRGNADLQQGTVAGEINNLEDSTLQLREALDNYLDSRAGVVAAASERELLGVLTALMNDAKTLKQQAYARAETNDLYRTFFILEYGLVNSWMQADETGYGQSLEPYFVKVSGHMDSLARLGFRNPRVQKPTPAGGGYPYRGSRSSQQRQPPSPSLVPAAPFIPPPQSPQGQNETGKRPDLGDLFRRLLR
jgi:hypothetical protein